MQDKYNSYLQAINNTVFGKIEGLIASMNDSETSIINSLEVKAEWESPVKDTLVIKVNEFKSRFRGFLSEKDNLQSIISISTTLKTYIEKYNELSSNIASLNSNLSSKQSEFNSFKSGITIPIPETDYATSDKYHNFISSIDGINSKILNTKNELSVIIQNIEECINKLKTIQFGTKTENIVVQTVAPVETVVPVINISDRKLDLLQAQIDAARLYIYGDIMIREDIKNKVRTMSEEDLIKYYLEHKEVESTYPTFDSNIFLLSELIYNKYLLLEKLNQEAKTQQVTTQQEIPTVTPQTTVDNSAYNLSIDALLSTPLSGFNNLFKTNYEEPIAKNIQAINLNSVSLREQLQLAAIVITNLEGSNDPMQKVAIDMARETHSRLKTQIEQNDLVRTQQEKLYQQYRASNNNGGMFSQDGEIRAIKLELENTKDPAKTEELKAKLATAVEKFNAENVSGLIPINTVLDPLLTEALSESNPFVSSNVPNDIKEGSTLSFLTQSFYNTPSAIEKLTPNGGEVTGYKVTDNRYSFGAQTYTLNLVPGGYTLNIGNNTYTYTKEKKND